MSGSTIQLQHCLERLAGGDAAARDELIEHACERLRRLTRKIFRDYRRVHRFEDTGDVLGNVVLRLMRTLRAVSPTSVEEFFQLAARDIRRELIDLARHYYGPQGLGTNQSDSQGPPKPDDTRVDADKPDLSLEPSRLLNWTEFHRRVESLPDEERIVVDLLWYQGLTQQQAADILKISLATLKRRWLAARLRFQEFFEQDRDTEP